jgi:hypothetical protein
VPEIPVGSNGLAIINESYDQIYAARTKVGQQAETLKGYALKMEAGLTPISQDGQDWGVVAREFTGKIAALKTEEADLIARMTKEVGALVSSSATAKLTKHTEIDREINAQVAALELERANRKNAANYTETAEVDAAKIQANINIKELRTRQAPQITSLTEQAATARERSDAQKREEGNREALSEARRDAAAKESDYKSMSDALARLTTLKATVAGRMKIKGIQIASPKPGMEVSICREQDGALIPFNIWNSEAQDLFMLRLSTMSHGKCGLVCMEMRNLNKARQESLVKTAQKYAEGENMQFVFCRADEPGTPLTVA